MDLILFNTIVNLTWYTLTVLFVLYKYTSFFSYVVNFIRFLWRLVCWVKKGVFSVYAYLRKTQGYTQLSDSDPEVLLPMRNKQANRGIKGVIFSITKNIRNWVANTIRKKKDSQPILPLHNPFNSLFYENQLEELYASADKDNNTSEFRFDVPTNNVNVVVFPRKNGQTLRGERSVENSELLFNSEYIFKKLKGVQEEDVDIATQYQSLMNNLSSSDSSSSDSD